MLIGHAPLQIAKQAINLQTILPQALPAHDRCESKPHLLPIRRCIYATMDKKIKAELTKRT